ncbi:MAG TPA: hypothetical protein VFX98_04955, partial [Longimicrobiaceae bacterium]|nr:hypothetical protein [Longimicrobiaceae bacterium]
MDDPSAAARAGEALLAPAWGGEVALEGGERLNSGPRSRIWRFRVARAPGGAPASVVVKQA